LYLIIHLSPHSQKSHLFGQDQPESEPELEPELEPESILLPSLILDNLQEIRTTKNQPSYSSQIDNGDNGENEVYSLQWENSEIPARNLQISLEKWNYWLKKWRRDEEKRRKEKRAIERLSLTKKRIEIDKKREKRLREEQKLRQEEFHRQLKDREQIKQKPSIQPSSSSNGGGQMLIGIASLFFSSNGKTHVNSYYRKDGTFVKGHDRKK
jgi:hypothetical protein